MKRLFDGPASSFAPSGERHQGRVVILAVGDTEEWLRQKRQVPPGGRIILAAFSDLSRELLDQINPMTVLSPVLARDFDCIDLAQMLFAVGYPGQYRVFSNDLPSPKIIRTEIRSLCPGLDFDVVVPSVTP
ncbi:MAG: hypothetical protein AAF871_08945 [Pseudomonadota bacterium]